MLPELDDTLTAAGSPAPPPSTSLPTGRQLGHFRIERLLGAGGMGEVYLATDLALDRPVAVKVLPEQLARDPKRRERLIREARAQARVAHPNVGHMYFIGEDGDRLYFAMELVNGETLADRIAKGPMTVEDALAVIRDAALGLREAQRMGFTHRDVKPSNLMVDGHGHVKVLDFGLAAGDAESAGGQAGPIAQTSLAGTPLYMAPEQARGEPVDLRTDIYALGGTLYHLIAGKPPFQADSVEGLVSQHATAARPKLSRRGTPRTQIGAIDQLCSRMLAPRPDDRFGSYDELLRAIDLASMTHTRPGGFWVRTIATLTDLFVVTIALMILLVLLSIFTHGGANVGLELVCPVLFVYQTLAVARWKSTLGKALVELEVVDSDTGERPSLSRAGWRAFMMFAVPGAAPWLYELGQKLDIPGLGNGASAVTALWCIFGVVSLAVATRRFAGKRAVWDRVAGTMVRYRTTRSTVGSSRA